MFLLIYKEQIQFVQEKENDCRGGWEANSVVHMEICTLSPVGTCKKRKYIVLEAWRIQKMVLVLLSSNSKKVHHWNN